MTFDPYHIEVNSPGPSTMSATASGPNTGNCCGTPARCDCSTRRTSPTASASVSTGCWACPLEPGRVLPLDDRLRGLYEIDDPDQAAACQRRWQSGAVGCGLERIIGFTHFVREDWLGIVRWWHSPITNGALKEASTSSSKPPRAAPAANALATTSP